jgi:hypothetical protein
LFRDEQILSTPAPLVPEDIAQSEEVDFEEIEEHWNVYKLKDGTTLKVKLILLGVKKLKKHNPDGTPLYLVNSQNIVRTVDIPKGLMAKPRESSMKPV